MSRHFAIVKVKSAVRENLIIFVALSCEKHNVAGARFVHGHANGFLAVGLDQIFSSSPLQSNDDVADDSQGLFGARIVARQNRQVDQPAGDFSHDGALGAIFQSAAAEERNDASFRIQLAGSANQVFQRIVCVRVVDDYKKRLPLVDALKAPGNTFEIVNAL